MAGLSWIDLFLRHIPEGLLLILAGYAVSRKKIDVNLYLLSSVIISICNFVFKSLPISTVLPMVLSGVVTVIILSLINKIKTVKAILSTIFCYVLLIISEGINMILLNKVFGLDSSKIFLTSNPLMKNIYGLPSLVIFGLIVIIYYMGFSRKKNKKNVIIK